MKLHLPLFLRKAILTLMLAYGVPVVHAADLTLGAGDSLSVDYSASGSLLDLNNGTLRLSGGTTLQLSSCGEGDGKTYILLTGVSELLDAQGNVISLDSTYNAASRYFDATHPGSGFWANGTLQLNHGALQMVLHNETVKDAITITTRQENPSAYQYYAGVSFENIEYVSGYSSAYGGAIYGAGDITLSDNGSVSFSGNTASASSYASSAYGGAIYGGSSSTITLNDNGSVTFSGNTASASSSDSYAYGGAIYGDYGSTITLNDNGSVIFSGNTASSSYSDSYAYGGAIYGSTITLSNNGSVVFEGNTAESASSRAFGGAIYGGSSSTITLSDNESVSFSGNTSSCGGTIYGYEDSTITLSDNGSVSFSGNTSSSYGGAIYGYEDSTITLSDNESVSFSGNTTSFGGAIYGYEDSTITLSDNGSVVFEGNTASSSSHGGAIYGDRDSTITLSDNGSVSFIGNTSSSFGGAIYGETITLSDNGSVSFIGNTASSSSSYNYWAYGGAIYGYEDSTITLSDNGSVVFEGNTASSSSSAAYGGAIYGNTITLSDNGSVTFSGNTASSSYSSSYYYSNAYGGAIYGSTITLSNNGSVSFIGNTASSSDDSARGGAICSSCDLSIRNNDSVEFYQNAEVNNGSHRLRSIHAYSDISLSAAAGKSITFRDSIYIGEGSSFKLNEAYEGTAQQGDIIFTGATTESDLYAVKGNVAGTAEEIQASRTTEVNTMTKLYGGRLRVEDGAIYQGRGITAHAGSGATVRVQNATLSHAGYDLTFNAGTTLELAGNNTISGNVQMLEGSSLLLNPGNSQLATYIAGEFNIADGVTLSLNLENTWTDVNGILMYVSGNTTGWSAEKVQISGTGAACSLTWVDNLLVVNYDDSSFNRFFNGSSVVTTTQLNGVDAHHYESLKYENLKSSADGETTYCSGGAIYGEKYSFISLNNNNVIEFSGNSVDGGYIARGGAIYGDSYSSICLSNNSSVTFSGNTASPYDAADGAAYGGAICGDYGSSISLSNNGSVVFRENTAMGDASTRGGAISAYADSSVDLSNNGSVVFEQNAASGSGGAIYGQNIMLCSNDSVSFVGNMALDRGGAIYGDDIMLCNNGSVTFCGNTTLDSFFDDNGAPGYAGGAIYSPFGTFLMNNNGKVEFCGNVTSNSYYDGHGGAICWNGPLSISNNRSVLFEKNAEIGPDFYRLRGIYYDNGASGKGEISLSAAVGNIIEIRDSIYVWSSSPFNINKDFTDSSGSIIKQQGDIIINGAYAEEHLNEVMVTAQAGRTATAEEILASRTTAVNCMTKIYGGRLRVENGAIYQGQGISVEADSGAAVWLRNAQLQHQGYSISFGKGTTFGLRGCNVSQSDNLSLDGGCSLTFEIAAENLSAAVLTHEGTLTLGGSVTLNIGTADSSLAYGQYKLLQVNDSAALLNWADELILVDDGSYATSDLEWVDNTLCFNYSGQQLSELPLFPEIADIPEPPDEPELPDTPGGDEPGGELPGGDEPGGDEPGGELPGGDEPGSNEPGGELPGGDEPGGDEPGGELPGGDEPGSNEPGGELPGGDEPGGDEPGGELPGGDEPGGELPGGDDPGGNESGLPDTPVTPDKPEQLKPFRPGDSALVSGEIDKNLEVILNGKGTLTLEGKVNAGAITVNIDKSLTFKSNKKKPGSLMGDGDLTKKGKGTLTLNDGNGTWTGDIYLEAGTIKVKGTTSLGKGDVYVQGGVLNLGSKAIANDIVQEKSAAIKSGKKFIGIYTLENGELQKGSTLNINKTATLAGGTVNGTLSGTGTTTVTGKVKLGDKGKITTKALTLGADATLTTSAKGLSSKTTTLSIGEDATLVLGGKMTVDSLKMNGSTLKTTGSKPAAITVKNNMELTDAVLTTNGKVTTNKLTLNDSTMSTKGAKAQNLTVKQNLTIGSGSALTLNGKLSAGSLTIKKDGMLTMTGSKPMTLKVKGALTLSEGSSIILNYSFVQGKTYKVLTFGSYSGSKDYYSIFGVEADDCTITNTGKALTLTVNTKWKPQTQQKAVSAEVSTPVVATRPQANPVADALVQSNWGQLEASRAFVNAIANRSMAVQLGNGERAVWASAIGSSSRHDTASGHNGADTNVSGGAFGLETQVGRASLFGMALGNSWTRVSAHGFGSIEQDTTHLGIYGQTNWRSGISADWSAAYGRSESESMGSDWNQKHLQLDGRVSYNHELNARTVLSPFAGVQYYASDSASIGTTDTGSLQNLRAEIGVGASHRTGKLGVFGEIALHQDLARNNPTVSMEGVRSTGMKPGRTGLNFTIGASYELTDKWSVNASYTGEFVENANAHSANVGATYKF